MSKNSYLPTKISKTRCFLLIILMVILYVIDTPSVASLMDGFNFNYIIKPMLWSGLAIIVVLFPKIHPHGKLKLRSFTTWWAFNFAGFFIVASVIGGFIDGFGKSPYSHTLKGIAYNILLIGATIVGREFARSYIVNSLLKEENYIIFSLIALLLTFTNIPLNSFLNFKGYEDIVKFAAQTFGPELSKNILACYLAFLGGPVASIAYLGTIEAVNWLSPILPNLKWITAGFIGVLVPIFSLIFLQGSYAKETRQKILKEDKEENIFSLIATTVFCIGIVWFSVGVFPIYPSVIATGSMEPMIKPGDVIIVKKNIDRKNLSNGDIIQFRSDNILISHRIIEVIDEKGQKTYRTKGDNNSIADSDAVKPEEIKGIIVKVVPKVGWPTLLLKSKKDVPLEKVQF